jgi:hypothetical protein
MAIKVGINGLENENGLNEWEVSERRIAQLAEYCEEKCPLHHTRYYSVFEKQV